MVLEPGRKPGPLPDRERLRARPVRSSKRGCQEHGRLSPGVRMHLQVPEYEVARTSGHTEPLPACRSSAAMTVNVHPESTTSSTSSTGPLGTGPSMANTPSRRDDRRRRLVVHDEPEIRLVIAHAESRGGDQRLDLVSQQPIFEMLAIGVRIFELLVRHVAVVGPGLNSMLLKPSRDLVRIAPGQRTDDSGSGQGIHVIGQPREAGLIRYAA